MSTELEQALLKVALLEAENRHLQQRTASAEAQLARVKSNPRRNVILNEIQNMKNKANKIGKKLYYDNQEAKAREIHQNIKDPKIVFQMLLAQCQAGKTGCMFALIEIMIKMDSNIDTNRIYIVTGLSSTDWVSQTQGRMPRGLRENIIHRNKLKEQVESFKTLKDALIIVDECQIASNKDMTFDNLLQNAGIKDLDYLRDNNVNIVEFSATPNSTLVDLELWKEDNACIKHIMDPGKEYIGVIELLEKERIQQAKDLYIDEDPPCGLTKEEETKHKQKIQPARDEIKRIKEYILNTYNSPKNHVFRVPSGSKGDTVIGRFKEICGGDSFEYTNCNCNIGKDLVDELKKEPEKHNLIFIKETARCAVTFEDTDNPDNDVKGNIGVLYERIPKTISDDVIIQGLVGRACGYGSNNITIFTNLPSIDRYVKMIKSGYEDTDEDTENFTWRGKKGKKTSHLHPNDFKGVFRDVSNHGECLYKRGEKKDLQDFFKKEFPGRGSAIGNRRGKNGNYRWCGKKITKEILQNDIDTGNLHKYITNQGTTKTCGKYLLAYYEGDNVKWCLIYRENI
jgi:hypothetical protein